jgi:hypothetical protein
VTQVWRSAEEVLVQADAEEPDVEPEPGYVGWEDLGEGFHLVE